MQLQSKVEQLSKSYGNLLAIDQISLSVKYGIDFISPAQTAQEKYND